MRLLAAAALTALCVLVAGCPEQRAGVTPSSIPRPAAVLIPSPDAGYVPAPDAGVPSAYAAPSLPLPALRPPRVRALDGGVTAPPAAPGPVAPLDGGAGVGAVAPAAAR
ncbi:hypothetical protein [Anaeromyxobacter paludicola]|uniref:Lipoprotein n=1 Tax=Anaeromyxobacter paludicola TaxID=2918171 RepID=A0ABN6N7F7_9BACT|nr:hypothetical protein [Anaeromyxobacter paludicola]BDG08976.1 hypothetical protein AMPC_20890 [Anaeromyxobacter paludicola]